MIANAQLVGLLLDNFHEFHVNLLILNLNTFNFFSNYLIVFFLRDFLFGVQVELHFGVFLDDQIN